MAEPERAASNPLLVLPGLMLLALGGIIVVAVLASGGDPAFLLVLGGILVLGGVLALGLSRRPLRLVPEEDAREGGPER